jgi:hypothetical protein
LINSVYPYTKGELTNDKVLRMVAKNGSAKVTEFKANFVCG